MISESILDSSDAVAEGLHRLSENVKNSDVMLVSLLSQAF
jgi:hypothetical protein